MPHGYTGKILRVNLSTSEISVEEPSDHFYRMYMGGWNIIAHYLLKELPPGIDPLSPDNLLVFATGVVTGAPIAGAGRSTVGAKSPLTGGFGEADVGGWWGTELTMAASTPSSSQGGRKSQFTCGSRMALLRSDRPNGCGGCLRPMLRLPYGRNWETSRCGWPRLAWPVSVCRASRR